MTPTQTPQERFDAALQKANLIAFRDELLAEARECIHFRYAEPVEHLPCGASHIGGAPDLPASVRWPDGSKDGQRHGKASFLAQINLTELPRVQGLQLPSAGYLWLFIRDGSLCQLPVEVIYRDGTEPLNRQDAPPHEESDVTDDWHCLRMAALTFTAGMSLPFSSKSFLRRWREQTPMWHALRDLREALDEDHDGRIGGFSYQAEHDLCREIAIERLGRPDCVHADAWESVAQLEQQIEQGLQFQGITPERQKSYREYLRRSISCVRWIGDYESRIAELAASIQFLCMFRSSRSIGLDFGDGMYLDFFIEERDLLKKEFSRVDCRLPMLL